MFEIDDFLQAAKSIREEGVDGALASSLLVGVNTTIAMLMIQMSNIKEQTQNTLETSGLLNVSHVTEDGERAVIYNNHGDLLLALKIENGTCIEVSIEGLHIHMWMSGAGSIREVCAGNAPYTKLKKHMMESNAIAYEEQWKHLQDLQKKGQPKQQGPRTDNMSTWAYFIIETFHLLTKCNCF